MYSAGVSSRALPVVENLDKIANHDGPPPEAHDVDDAVRGRDGLTDGMREASYALAETLFTTEDGPPDEDRLTWLVNDLDHFLSHAGPRARTVYRLCLFAISSLAPALIFRLPPFRKLSLADRAHALERMEQSPAGLAVFGAKAILCILWYEHPASAREIGFDARCKVR